MRFLLILLPLLASAAVTVKRVEPTNTQVVLEYVAPSASACTIEVSEAAGYSPVVHDVNATLFTGANSDARAGNVTDGTARIFVVGQRTSGTASDGKLYSRALQTATLHYYRVTCGGDTATGTFRTTTPPLGNTAVELPPFNADGFGNYAWPTVDWNDQSKSYIDPMTGVLVKAAYQIPGRQSNSDWGTPLEYAFTGYVDPNAAWTDAGNILNKSTGGPFATYAGAAQDPLFVSFAQRSSSWNPGWGDITDDIRLTLYGSGDNATASNRTMLACLSIDSQTCVSAEIEVVLPQTTPAAVSGPATYPLLQFSGWTVGRFLRRNEISTQSGTVNTAVKVVSLVTMGPAYYFDTNWAAGSKIYIAGSSGACTNSLCTIASVDSARQITLVETVGTLTGAAYRSAAWGIRLRKKTATGSVSLNSSHAVAWSKSQAMPLNGGGDFCSTLTTSVAYAADGTTPITPTPGRLCVMRGPLAGETVLAVLLDETGEVRLLSDLNENSMLPYGSFSPSNALKLYYSKADDTGGSPRLALYEIAYNAATGKFKAWPGTNYQYSARPSDYLTWTNLTPYSSNLTINEQIAAAITSNTFYKSAMGSAASFQGVLGNYAVYSMTMGGTQNSPCFVIRFNITTGLLAQIADTMGGFSSTGRWGGCHSISASGADNWLGASVSLLNGFSSTSYMHGPFEALAVSHVYKAGAWNVNTAVDQTHFYTCTVGNPYEGMGATGANCLKIRVTGEPCSAYPTTAEKADYPCPWDANRSMPQTLQPGDYLWTINTDRSFDGKNEKMLVVSKTAIGGGAFELEVMRAATCRGVAYYDGDEKRTHDNGWTFVMSGTGLCGGNSWYVDATGSSWYTEDGAISNQHGAIGSGLLGGLYTTIVAGSASRFSQSMVDQLNQPATYTQAASTSAFNGVSRGSGEDVQSYLSKGQWTAPTSEQAWALDLRHYNPSAGGGSEIGVAAWAQTYSLVAGKTQTYLISVNGAQTGGKTFPFLAWAGYNLLRDKSGPGSTIGDADTWRYCVAYATNECIAGSSVGNAYVNVPQATTSASCIVNQYAENYPCFTNGYWFGGWATQHDVSRNDPFTRYQRRLTMGFTGPGRQYQFKNIHATPDGRWGFIETGWVDGVRDDMLLVKLPPWPSGDSVNRGVFVNVPVSIGPGADKARVRFGYDANFYCTSRAEACVTDGSVSPFAFVASDSLTPVTCSSGCTINVPTVAGRILYYRIERLDAGGTQTSQGLTQVAAVN